ncbi:alpha/beta-type small acid-soluble spore protein [Clostridium ganghwense]|uniref:Alpha/beta-type small acid-soluble spore protein n=1 Tax=Clostridium ganghwense TaxID=312089 RepID=A0ABT4CU50_9CLOT|nr:alpha/beta-type small acid-soluble spore protein [Clostridium ganghwense]MCY6372562.1 alpha/beta-type small acid-soluble spore protein [Clostridium ganghwense]
MSKRPAVPKSKEELNKFKIEVAKDMGLEEQTEEHEYMGDVPTKIASKMARGGNVGGEMVKRMIASVESNMINKK